MFKLKYMRNLHKIFLLAWKFLVQKQGKVEFSILLHSIFAL